MKTVKIENGKWNLVKGTEVISEVIVGKGELYETKLPNKAIVRAATLKSLVTLSAKALA